MDKQERNSVDKLERDPLSEMVELTEAELDEVAGGALDAYMLFTRPHHHRKVLGSE